MKLHDAKTIKARDLVVGNTLLVTITTRATTNLNAARRYLGCPDLPDQVKHPFHVDAIVGVRDFPPVALLPFKPEYDPTARVVVCQGVPVCVLGQDDDVEVMAMDHEF